MSSFSLEKLVSKDIWRIREDILSYFETLLEFLAKVLVHRYIDDTLWKNSLNFIWNKYMEPYESHYAKIGGSKLNVLDNIIVKFGFEAVRKTLQVIQNSGGDFLRHIHGGRWFDAKWSRWI